MENIIFQVVAEHDFTPSLLHFQIRPGLNANEIQISYDKHHKVSLFIKSHQNIPISIKYEVIPGAIIGDGNRKSWDPRAPMIWDSFSIFRTNWAILTSYNFNFNFNNNNYSC